MIYIPAEKKVLIAHHGMTLTCEEDCAMLEMMCTFRKCNAKRFDVVYRTPEVGATVTDGKLDGLLLEADSIFLLSPNGVDKAVGGRIGYDQIHMSKKTFSVVWTAISLTMYAIDNKFDVVLMPDRAIGPKVIEHISYLSFVGTRMQTMVQFPFANHDQSVIDETYIALKNGKYVDPTIPKEAKKPMLEDLKPVKADNGTDN